VDGVGQKKRADAEELSDFLACYGVLPRAGLNYGDYVGLVLNFNRQHRRRAAEAALGVSWGRNGVGADWAAAVASDPAEAAELAYQAARQRAEARAAARAGFR
jgi:hypothetical protein